MKEADFTESSPGRLVRTLDGVLTFVPSPLPGKVQWNDGLIATMGFAEAALGQLAGLGHKFPNPTRLVRLFLRREAELSSRIENTFATVRTQLLHKDVPEVAEKSPDVREVENNFRALEYGLKAIRRQPISGHLIKSMQDVLLRGVRGQEKSPGQYRRVQAHIGTTADITMARFVPSPPHAIQDCMDKLVEFIQSDERFPRIAKIAMAHYQFEAIHPFADGNGRVGRVLILLMMCQMRLLPLPLLNPSAYLERNRALYYDHLLEVSHAGRWDRWIQFFAEGVIDECARATKRIRALEQLRERYQRQVRQTRSSAKLSQLVDELFGQPKLTLDVVMKLLDVWSPSAQRFIDRLVDLKIVREVTGKQRNRVYLADGIVNVFATREA